MLIMRSLGDALAGNGLIGSFDVCCIMFVFESSF